MNGKNLNLLNFGSDSEIKDVEVEEVLSTLQEEATLKLQTKDYKSAIIYLKKSEELLEALMTQSGKLIYTNVIFTLHNLAFCYQKISDFPKSLAYIDACIYNLNTHVIFPQDNPAIQNKLKKAGFLTKSHIQACAVLSQLGNHRLALTHARKSISFALSSVKLTLKAAGHYSSSYFGHKSKSRKIPDGLLHIMSLISIINPALNSLQQFISHQKTKKFHFIPSVLGVKDHTDWTFQIHLPDIMLIQPISMQELNDKTGIQLEFTKDAIIMKVCLLSISYFCASTELQFLQENEKEAKKLHELAVKAANGFLPKESKLLSHLKETLKNRFSIQAKVGKTEDDIGIRIIDKILPVLPDRCMSLTPSHRFRKVTKKSEFRKNGENTDLVLRKVYKSEVIDRKKRNLSDVK